MVSAGRAFPRYSPAADLQGEKNGITSPTQRLEKLLYLIGSIPLSPFRKVIRRIIPQYGRGSQVRVIAMPPDVGLPLDVTDLKRSADAGSASCIKESKSHGFARPPGHLRSCRSL